MKIRKKLEKAKARYTALIGLITVEDALNPNPTDETEWKIREIENVEREISRLEDALADAGIPIR